MSKRAILAHAFVEYWVDVAAKLRDEYGWEICYFIGQGKHKEKTLKLFPDSVFNTKSAFRRIAVGSFLSLIHFFENDGSV